MKIAVSASGVGLDASFDGRFGRCSHFVIVDATTLEWKMVDNGGAVSSGGAGIQAAQTVVNEGVEAVLTGNIGPNAFEVLEAAKIIPYVIDAKTVRQAIEQFTTGKGTPAGAPTNSGHFAG